ncbi:MAG: hypothetical protein PHV07_02675 [Oscillospiraceae bacterium]|nr:hypothetical protein [Oscillospiraceae bacterium]
MDITKVNQNFSLAIKEVEQRGMITIKKYGKDSYVLMTNDFFRNLATYFKNSEPLDFEQIERGEIMDRHYKLHEAMLIVLQNAPNKKMRYTDLADEIWERKLYTRQDGNKATSGQIYLRARNYNKLFEIVDKHYIVIR